MAKCQAPNCPNKDKDVATGRIIHTMSGQVIEGMFCMNCALKLLYEGSHGNLEVMKWQGKTDTSKSKR